MLNDKILINLLIVYLTSPKHYVEIVQECFLEILFYVKKFIVCPYFTKALKKLRFLFSKQVVLQKACSVTVQCLIVSIVVIF